MENPGRVYSREQLLDSVWGHGIYVESRTVDTHIRRLRKAINTKGTKNFIEQFAQRILYRLRIKSLSLSC